MVDLLRRPFRHVGVALARCAVASLPTGPQVWPDLQDPVDSRRWLEQVWHSPLADGVQAASPILAQRVHAICGGAPATGKQLRRAVLAVARYRLRAQGRPTPFGLFAGVAPARIGATTGMAWGESHRPVIRADTQWLAALVSQLEAIAPLLQRLEVMANDLVTVRGEWLELPHSSNRVRVRRTGAVRAVLELAARPIRFDALAAKVAAAVGSSNTTAADEMLTSLVEQGVLITCFHAPYTVTNPLRHVLEQLHRAGAPRVPVADALLRALEHINASIDAHNRPQTQIAEGATTRAELTSAMRQLSTAGRSPLAVDVTLDCQISLGTQVVDEIERAAGVLLRLARDRAGSAAWRAYHAAFCDRYGTGTLVPVREVVHPDAGLGFPAGYPASMLAPPVEKIQTRDQRLLAAAWQAVHDDNQELVLTDSLIDHITDGWRPAAGTIAPHVEIAARIDADSSQAIDQGRFRLRISPARAGGVLTSRFTATITGSGLEDAYRHLPTSVAGALPVQMSFPAAYPHADNITRIPPYLSHVLPLGEHRDPDETTETLIGVDDVAVVATPDRLHAVSRSRRQILEPQVFHALALDKQPPPLARFLANLTRAFLPSWTAFDWGPAAHYLPYLPQVRYGRTILTPARWQLRADELPTGGPGPRWRTQLTAWRARWRCPPVVDLRDDDRSLRLELDHPLHAAILHAHLARHPQAVLTTATKPDDVAWAGGHVHEIAVPLASTHPAVPCPPLSAAPTLGNTHGDLPAAPAGRWLQARLLAHPDSHDQILTEHLPRLVGLLDDPDWWFIRYRDPHQSDHLRLRIRQPADPLLRAEYAAAVSVWADQLRHASLSSGLILDSYIPEVGRYGTGAALDAAESVFVADSRLALAALRHRSRTDRLAWATMNLADLAVGMHDAHAAEWLARRKPAGHASPAPDRAVADEAIRGATAALSDTLDLDAFAAPVAAAWKARRAALAAYRATLTQPLRDRAGWALLHMHHNRSLGIDPEQEAVCLRLTRQAALATLHSPAPAPRLGSKP